MNEDYLEEMTSLKDYDSFYKLKCQKDSVQWSGFDKGPDYDKFKQYVLENLIENVNNHLFFLRDGKTSDIMGYCQYNEYGNGIAEARGTTIFKRYQGCGLASIMNGLLLIKARDNGISYIYAWCSDKNSVSMNALIDAGYKKTDVFEERYMSVFEETHKFYKWEIYL